MFDFNFQVNDFIYYIFSFVAVENQMQKEIHTNANVQYFEIYRTCFGTGLTSNYE